MYFIGIDVGTESCRCGVFDSYGRVVSVAEKGYTVYYPEPGRAEIDMNVIFGSLKSCLKECVNHANKSVGINIKDITALCCDSTASTVLAVDRDGKPLMPAILWCDVRASMEASEINRRGNAGILRYCGGSVSPEWLLPKALWIKREKPGIYKKAFKILEACDWITWMLTGELKASMCSAVCKANYLQGWNEDFFREVGLEDYREKLLQDVLPMGSYVGKLKRDVAESAGLNEIIVAEGGVDAHCGMLGLGCTEPKELAAILGSSSVYLLNDNEPHFIDGIWGPYRDAVIEGSWTHEGGQISSGSVIKWFRDNFASDESYAALDHKAETVQIGSKGIIALEYFQGNRTPHKDPLAKGLFLGMRLGSKKEEMYRAILEACAYGMREIIESFHGADIKELRVCGGQTNSNFLLQMYSDVCGLPIYMPEVKEASILGCAALASVAYGTYRDIREACKSMVRMRERIEPEEERAEQYAHYYGLYREAYRKNAELMHMLE